jgi:hypothetical protein
MQSPLAREALEGTAELYAIGAQILAGVSNACPDMRVFDGVLYRIGQRAVCTSWMMPRLL